MLEIQLKEQGKLSRLTNKTFQFDQKLKEGFYAANYFLKTHQIVDTHYQNHIVTMQFFQREDDIMACGIDEAIALIHTFAIDPEHLTILALNDGDMVNSYEPVLKIIGRYEHFGFLESMIDGILSRRSSVATNTFEVIKAANGKPVFSMADRQDDYHTQIGDGYASYVGGIKKISTDAQGLWWGGKGMGTIPHALIQICDGDVKKALDLYHKTFPDQPLTALIDYNNDVINDSLEVARHFGHLLNAVRVDTSISLIDQHFQRLGLTGDQYRGVNKHLIIALRAALDLEGFNYVNIVVSSGFEPEKIHDFESNGVPVSMYGVGSYLVKIRTNFTGDLVTLDGKAQAKVGRYEYPSNRLKKVSYPIQ